MTLVPTVIKGLRPLTFEPNPITLGGHLKKRRTELGLFQKEVAVQMNVDEFAYLGWEHDRAIPKVSFWPRIIHFLGYDPNHTPQTLGEQIAAQRRKRGIDHRCAAKIIGVDDGTLLRYERGEWTPKGDRLLRVVSFVKGS